MYEESLDEETFGYAVEHNFNPQTLQVSVCEDIRWQRCDIKSTSLLGNVLSMNQAKKMDVTVIMHKANLLTEGGASNIFFATDDCIYTPSLANNILPGITGAIDRGDKKYGLNFRRAITVLKNYLVQNQYGLLAQQRAWHGHRDSKSKCNLVLNHKLFLECERSFNDKYLS